MRGTCNILVERDGAEEECGKPSVYSEPCCCCVCATDFEEQPLVHYCTEHFDELVILPEGCWHCGTWMTIARPIAPKQETRSEIEMSEYRQCECPYHDDGDGFIGGVIARTRAESRPHATGYLCAECHDQLEAAWKYGLEHRDEIVVLDEDGDRVT